MPEEVMAQLVADDELQLFVIEGLEQRRREQHEDAPVFRPRHARVEARVGVHVRLERALEAERLGAVRDERGEPGRHRRRHPQRRGEERAANAEVLLLLGLVDEALDVRVGEQLRFEVDVTLCAQVESGSHEPTFYSLSTRARLC